MTPARKPLVMLVEDDPDNLEVLEFGLTHYGAVVQPYGTAGEALAALQAVVPDALVTDLAMPQRDGFWLVEQVRRIPSLTRLPIIVVTGHGERSHVESARHAGVDDVLLKPVDSRAIYQRIQQRIG